MQSIFLSMSFVLISMFAISCQSDKSKDKGNSAPKPENVQVAFEHILKILHDPFAEGHCFFKTNFADVETAGHPQNFHVKNLTEHGGTGSYMTIVHPQPNAITGTGSPDDKITYVYKNFKPKDSRISVDGSLMGTRWDRDSGLLSIKNGEKLEFSGDFKATLEFVNKNSEEHFEINNGNGDAACGSKMNISKGKMIFTYKDINTDNTIEFDSNCGCGDQDRLERLLKVPVNKTEELVQIEQVKTDK